ncbi:MAG: restriction endonuclease subunit S, partial [Proteobacteria bacterium]|nr:restriction endonuclease subunit S [Pseudomonadota bacterium]
SLVPEGSVLLVTRSGILAHTLPVAVTKLPVAINQDLKALSPRSGVSPKYVAHAVRGASRQILKECSKHGTTVASIATNALLDFEIPLVDLSDQNRIVSEIEKQFSRLDQAVANLKRVKSNLKRYKAAILKAAVEGRLVPTEAELASSNCHSYETGDELLQGILDDRCKQWRGRGKYRGPVAPDLSRSLNVPNGWGIASLDQLTSKITSGSRDWSRYYNRGTSTFVLAQNVRPLAPDFSSRQFVDPPRDDPSRERSRIEVGDLLATIVGANTGQVCLVDVAPGDAYVCQSVALIRPTAPGVATYLNYWLNSEEHGQRYFRRCMYGQGRPHLSFEQLMATPIALPPFAEQQRIVAEADRRLSLVSGIEAEVNADLKRASAIRQATLRTAFASAKE